MQSCLLAIQEHNIRTCNTDEYYSEHLEYLTNLIETEKSAYLMCYCNNILDYKAKMP